MPNMAIINKTDKKFKILLLNLEYCLDVKASVFGIAARGYRYLFCPKKTQKRTLNHLNRLIHKIQPDLCCFVEIDRGSRISNRINQINKLTNGSYHFHSIENKYKPKGLLRRLPFFCSQCNGFLAKKDLPHKTFFLKKGLKKLVYQIQINSDTALFLVHFSLSKKIRKAQLLELEKLLPNAQKLILCGDFNIFRGMKEINWFIEKNNLKVINPASQKTFPSHKPKKNLDLFLASKNLNIAGFNVLSNVKISDHLPVLMEIKT